MTWLCILCPAICFAFAGILAAMDTGHESDNFLVAGLLLFFVSILVLSTCS